MWLNVRAQLTYDFAKACETLLLIEAARGADQTVHDEVLTLSPNGEVARLDDSLTGERRAVIEAHGRLKIDYRATVEVAARDHHAIKGAAAVPIRDLPGEALRYLRPSRYCPSDRFERFVHREFGHLQGGDKVEAILDWICAHVDYTPGVSDSATTAVDTFTDRAGGCRDFAHLAICLCRAAEIPARAVSAYAWKLQPADLHAVVEVFVGGRWRLADPTRKAPVEGLVRIASGGDAADIAFMTVFGAAELVSQSFEVKKARGRTAAA